MLSLADKLRRRSNVEARPVGDGAVLVDLASGRCFELNPVGTEIWERLDGAVTLGEIRDGLRARYATAAADLVERDVLELGAALVASALVERAS